MPPKPTLDGEPRYEDMPISFEPAKGRFDDYDVRQAAYWSLLSGAMGHTYGNNNIWQFYAKESRHEPLLSAATPWKTALEQPGAGQMLHVRCLFDSRPFTSLEPDGKLIRGKSGKGGALVKASSGEDYAFIYIPTGRKISVRLDSLTGEKANAWWFDPRNGAAHFIGAFSSSGTKTFTPPGSPRRGNDWVLVIDDVDSNYSKPGCPSGTAPGGFERS